MNKIDEIRAKLAKETPGIYDETGVVCSDWIDTVLEIIAPYLSHGITEEEAKTVYEWYRKNELVGEYDNAEDFVIAPFRDLGLITSSRDPFVYGNHYLIKYEDIDKPDVVFTDVVSAMETFEANKNSWNSNLFREVTSSREPIADHDDAPIVPPVVMTANVRIGTVRAAEHTIHTEQLEDK